MRTALKITLFTVSILFFTAFTGLIQAVEYGGIGGKPAYPDEMNPRTKSIFIFQLAPGEEAKNSVQVINNTNEQKTLIVYAADSVKSSDGSFACKQYVEEKVNVGSWIDVSKEEVVLEADSFEIVDFTVSAPTNASVGEQNGCILIQEKKVDETAQSGLSLSFRTGLRVAVTIPGEQIRKLELNPIVINQDQTESKIAISSSITNVGNVSIDTMLNLQVRDILGYSFIDAQNEYPILRDDTGVFNFTVDKPFWGGFMIISQNIAYDESDQAIVGVNTTGPLTLIESENQTIFIAPNPIAIFVYITLLIMLIAAAILYVRYRRARSNYYKLWKTEYLVKQNDDINSIATKYGLNWKEIAKVNRLSAPYTLVSGQKLKIRDQ